MISYFFNKKKSILILSLKKLARALHVQHKPVIPKPSIRVWTCSFFCAGLTVQLPKKLSTNWLIISVLGPTLQHQPISSQSWAHQHLQPSQIRNIHLAQVRIGIFFFFLRIRSALDIKIKTHTHMFSPHTHKKGSISQPFSFNCIMSSYLHFNLAKYGLILY